MTERFRFALNEYLSALEAQEAARPFAQRRQIPTIIAIVNAIKERYPDNKLHRVTAYNLASGKTKMLTYDTAQLFIDELWFMGFRPSMNELFVYKPPEG